MPIKRQPKDKLERVIRLKIGKSFRLLGFWDRHEQDFGPTFVERPDLFCYNFFGPTVVVEVKRITSLKRDEAHFDLDQIRDGQRKWMDRAVYFGGAGNNIYLAIGTAFSPERVWLIPWKIWVDFEKSWVNMRPSNLHIPIGTLEITFPFYGLVLHEKSGLWDLTKHPVGLLEHSKPRVLPKDFVPISLRFGKEK